MAAVDLTPGEALLLLEPNKRQGSEAIKVSLMWLLAKKCLTASLEDKPGFLGRFLSRTSRLHPSDRLPADLPSEMDNLMQLVRRTGYMDDFVKAARIQYGNDLTGFQIHYLIPSLLKRRLIEPRTEPFLIVFSRTRYYRTRSGEALRQQIDTLFARAREIPGYLDRSPAQAAALAATLGGLIFLMPELRPHFTDIAHAMRRPIGADASMYTGDTCSGSSPRPNEPLVKDTMALDFTGFDAGAFDAFDAGMTALDASFDAAASSGGAADGGSDGGGGGGAD